MTPEQHKAIARFISRKVVNEQDYAPIDAFLTDDYCYHGLGGMAANGPHGFKAAIAEFHAAIPDLKSEILDMVAEDDRLVIRFNFTGTHQGTFLGFAPTGVSLHFGGMIMRRFVNGKVAEDWDYFDFPTVVAQIQTGLNSKMV